MKPPPSTTPPQQRDGGRPVAAPFAGQNFAHLANAPPRVVSSVLLPLCFPPARCRSRFSLMKNAISSPHLLPPIPSQRPDEKRKLCPAQFTPKAARRWAVVARCPSGSSLFLSHASRSGAFLPFFSLFAFPRRTLKWAAGSRSLCLPFSSSSSPCPGTLILPSFNLLAGLVLVQTHLETDSLLSTFLKIFFSKSPAGNALPAQLFPKKSSFHKKPDEKHLLRSVPSAAYLPSKNPARNYSLYFPLQFHLPKRSSSQSIQIVFVSFGKLYIPSKHILLPLYLFFVLPRLSKISASESTLLLT